MDNFRRNNLNNNRLNEYNNRVNNSSGNFNVGDINSKKFDKNIIQNNKENNNTKFTMRNGFISIKKNKI